MNTYKLRKMKVFRLHVPCLAGLALRGICNAQMRGSLNALFEDAEHRDLRTSAKTATAKGDKNTARL